VVSAHAARKNEQRLLCANLCSRTGHALMVHVSSPTLTVSFL
jgi:hypothetical protein